jgi:hypothetical protein
LQSDHHTLLPSFPGEHELDYKKKGESIGESISLIALPRAGRKNMQKTGEMQKEVLTPMNPVCLPFRAHKTTDVVRIGW